MKRELDRIVARFAAEPVSDVSEGARELLREIVENEPAPTRRRAPRRLRLRLAIPTVALLSAAIMALTWVMPNATATALDIRKEGGYYVIEIKDLYADPELYETQLRTAGLDITLRVIPATAAFEGQVFPTSPDNRYLTEITGIYPPGPCDKLDGCAIGVKIPVGFKGTAQIDVGRKAQPGERYQSTTSWEAKGEPMHCVPYYNKTVAEVRAMLKERGITIEKFIVADPSRKDALDYEEADSVPDSLLVHGGFLTEPRRTSVIVHSSRLPQRVIDKRNKVNSCPSS
ncbi:hypothetical protein [Nonomuraea turcica]|uniref:hypothetical protein n=1 Tax=Nonomuraea sp. G32 TaxID=3067274 RepID=UPI00273BB84E|nr:hypothetical protein [Nonomuraea sp. G32]MDP4506033.1 hypothetical protein [Nonomuraea sp. G32]